MVEDMTSKDEVMERLKGMSRSEDIEGMSRFGIDTRNALGVRMPQLRRKAKGIGADERLADDLWGTGVREGRILATMVHPPGAMSRDKAESWLAAIEDWETCDQLCMNILRHHPDALDWARQWSRDGRLFVRRAAFATLASAAVSRKGAQHGPDMLALMPMLEDAASDQRPLVRKSILWALRSLAKRGGVCKAEVSAAVHRMASSEDRARSTLARAALGELLRDG